MKEKPKAPAYGFGARTTKILSSMAGRSKSPHTAANRAMSNTVTNTVKQSDMQLHHAKLMESINIDTVGVELPHADASLPRAFTVVGPHGEPIPDSHWGRGRAKSDFGAKTIRVWARGRKTKQSEGVKQRMLYIEGSPAYHYQGHNVVSSNDLTMLAHEMVKAVYETHPLNLHRGLRLLLARGRYAEVTRLDVAVLVRVPDGMSKAALVNAVALANVMAGGNMSLYANEATYGDPSSQVQAWKLYDKFLELLRKGKFELPESDAKDALIDLCGRTLRLEFVYRKKFFQNHAFFKGRPVYPAHLTPDVIAWMVMESLNRLHLKGRVHRRYGMDELLSIPLPYRSTFAHWQNGLKVRQFLEDDTEFRKHQRFLRARLGINIEDEPPSVIGDPVELFDILHPKNFVPAPDVVKADSAVFHQACMKAAVRHQMDKMGRKSVGVGMAPIPVQFFDDGDSD